MVRSSHTHCHSLGLVPGYGIGGSTVKTLHYLCKLGVSGLGTTKVSLLGPQVVIFWKKFFFVTKASSLKKNLNALTFQLLL